MKTNKWLIGCLGVVAAACALVAKPQPGHAQVVPPPQELFFPSARNDGRMITLAGEGIRTLCTEITFRLAMPAGTQFVEFGVFDGDSAGLWDVFDPAYASNYIRFDLYADPDGDGDGDKGKPLYHYDYWTGQTMPDNQWVSLGLPHDPRAQAVTGNYFYKLVISLDQPRSATSSNFKLSCRGSLSMNPETFAYTAPYWGPEMSIIYPINPATGTRSLAYTPYNGKWDMYLDVPPGQKELVIWDGDCDRGGVGNVNLDTDDPDTANDYLPPWVNTAAPANYETVASGAGCATWSSATGCPADDTGSAAHRRSPAIRYTVIAPDGQTWENENPSGNQEWEQFKISTEAKQDTFDPVSGRLIASNMDYHTDTLPAGVYRICVEGVDLSNLNGWHFPVPSLGVPPDGPPPDDRPRSLLIGDRVWYDGDKDGFQDANEPGIAGVKVNYVDNGGNVLGTQYTNQNGYYNGFAVDPGQHQVQVDPSNFLPGGALHRLDTTTGSLINQVVDAENALTFDFGYYGLAKLGDLVWMDSNENGAYNPEIGELPLKNVGVSVYGDLNGDGNPDFSADKTTNASGLYLASELSSGQYTAWVVSGTTGLRQTYDADGLGTANRSSLYLASEDNLLQDFGFVPVRPLGTGTPGYWKNHPEAWPVDEITIGGVTYSKALAIQWMQVATKKDVTTLMFQQIVAAKLNVMIGNSGKVVGDFIITGDAWLATYKVGTGVPGKSEAWKQGEPAHTQMDRYNNGLLDAPSRG